MHLLSTTREDKTLLVSEDRPEYPLYEGMLTFYIYDGREDNNDTVLMLCALR